MKLHSLVALPLLALGLATAAPAEPRFQGLGFLPGYPERSIARDVSADGCVVVGESRGLSDQAVRWLDGESEALAPLSVGNDTSQALAVSGDGRVITGQGPMKGDWYNDGVAVWDHGIPIGIAPSSDHHSARGSAASADGRVLVGSQYQNEGPYHHGVAFRYEKGAYSDLGWLPGGGPPSSALDVSADGSVLVGWATAADGKREAFRWQAGVMLGLGRLPRPDLERGLGGLAGWLQRGGQERQPGLPLEGRLDDGPRIGQRPGGQRRRQQRPGSFLLWTEAAGQRPWRACSATTTAST